MIFIELFWGFFKVSCFTFGGGFGAIALIRDLVLGNGWLDDEMLTYMIAVGESTPGPIMVNLATYIGSAKAGFAGAAAATFAVVLPAFLIITSAPLPFSGVPGVNFLSLYIKNRHQAHKRRETFRWIQDLGIMIHDS